MNKIKNVAKIEGMEIEGEAKQITNHEIQTLKYKITETPNQKP